MKKKPRLANVLHRGELSGVNRHQGRKIAQMTVKKHELLHYEKQGWKVLRHNKASIRLQRPRRKSDLLEARVWRLLYKMEFPYLSGVNGAMLVFDSDDPMSVRQQIDVCAIDDEVAIAIECKSYDKPKKDALFTEKITKHQSIRGAFARAVDIAFPPKVKRKVATPIFTWHLKVRDSDRRRADEAEVTLFSEDELEYYEALVNQLGPAARYQLLADLFRGKDIPGLQTRVPALRTKMGPLYCYTFAVRPQYLLKISYIAHRAKGKPGDIEAYQRMVKKKRLKQIANFISDNGMFPTNIVINFADQHQLRFDQGKQEGDTKTGAVFGWLTLNPYYGSAWIIDGQHRLFAYSGHSRASSSFLNVLAFHGLSGPEQTAFFVDINSEQRRVPRNLLIQLDAVLKWNSPNEDTRVNAIISRACLALDRDDRSPLRGRVLLTDMRRTDTRCISLTALAEALRHPSFFIVKRTKNFRQYGFLWRDNPDLALRRTVTVVSCWLNRIAKRAANWWELGAGVGGGLAMNDGVIVCIRMLRSVLEHLGLRGTIGALDDNNLVNKLYPYANAIGDYFAQMSPDERRSFRALRGRQGHDTGMRMFQSDLSDKFNNYKPAGLKEWKLKQRATTGTNEEAWKLIDHIEKAIQDRVLSRLKKEFDKNPDAWWYEGVPKSVRKKVSDRREEAGGGRRERFFDLIHYEAIIKNNWVLFRLEFAYGSRKNIGRERGTAWIREIAEWRNKVMHPSRRDYLRQDDLSKLKNYLEWLNSTLLLRRRRSRAGPHSP